MMKPEEMKKRLIAIEKAAVTCMTDLPEAVAYFAVKGDEVHSQVAGQEGGILKMIGSAVAEIVSIEGLEFLIMGLQAELKRREESGGAN